MILRLTFFASLFALTTNAFAGASNGVLNCQSASGRTTLSADYPIDMTFAAAKLTVDGQSISYVNADKIEDAKINQYDLTKEYPNYVEKQILPTMDHGAVALWVGIDSGKKFDENDLVLTSSGAVVRKKIPNGYILNFHGAIEGVDPRNTQVDLPKIEVTCTLKYQI